MATPVIFAEQPESNLVKKICLDCQCDQVIDWGRCVEPVDCLKTSSIEKSLIEKVRHSSLIRCKSCHLVSRNPALSVKDLETLYSSLPASRWDYEPQTVNSWSLANQWMQRHIKINSSIRIMDVGAFDGSFLGLLPDAWDKFAIEPSDALIERLEQKKIKRVGRFLQDVVGEQVDKEQIAPSSLDVVTLFDVFEHLGSPSSELCRIHQLLAKDGVLILSTGNSDHWSVRRLRGNHWYFHSVQHVCMANYQYLNLMARKIGYRIVHFKKHSHLQGTLFDRWEQSLSSAHFWSLRQSGWKRKLSRFIQLTDRSGRLIHQSNAPHATALQDHFIAVLQKI